MLPEKIVYLAFLFHLVAYVFYFQSILKGHSKPNLVSWIIWTLAPFIAVFFQLKAGAGLVSIPTLLAGLGPLSVVIFYIFKKEAYWKLGMFDFICGALAMFALVLYIFTHNLGISMLFAVLSDGLAAVPTITKSWSFPDTENVGPYLAGVFGNTLGLLIITNWIFTIYAFSVYNILINVIIIFCIYRKKILPHIVAFFYGFFDVWPPK